MKDLLARMFDKNPESRPTIDEVLDHAWFKDGTYPNNKEIETRTLKIRKMLKEKESQL